jgi:glucose-6-phosphate dehydrogenase assembly protein OpcA
VAQPLAARAAIGARTSVVTLVVLATDDDEEARACEATRRLAGRHPGRTIVLRCVGDPDGPPHVESETELQQEGGVWWEEVRLHVSGRLTEHLDSLVEPLTLPELPVALWFVGRLPLASDPLLGSADIVLVDSRGVGDTEAPPDTVFPAVAELVRRYPVVDLSWIRLQPWRRLLASLFDGTVYQPYVHRVVEAEVRGKAGPRRLLAGWLAARLGLLPAAVHLHEARHVSMRLVAEGAVFEVERPEGERLVRASARIDGGPSHEDVVSLPDDSLPWSLAEALTHLGRDRGYEQALHALLGFPP